ncbi:hypothetical protein CEP54_006154 [Fusarium duplospermum]|uniref:Uncharacterized protein n=1 Tax=Fusarium duplospermum TaxID=1325734 RepID=A0A428Q8K9_9HYPO|nr:hypothetical protein CEP54_006154 [Fusarium duplospermum]
MVRTRAADRQDVTEPSTRRNPSRTSRAHVSAPPTRSTRSRKAVVYPRDTSSDDGNSNSSNDSLDQPSEPEVESDEDSGDESHFQTRSRRNKSRSTGNVSARISSRRSARQAAMGQAQVEPGPARSETRSNARRQTKKRPKPLHKKVRSSKKRRTSLEPEQIPQGVIPNWRDPQIPYGAWVDIFYWAAVSGGHDTLDVNWLISTATTCKAFSEAALTAIYRCPPLLTSGKARRFAALLELPPSGTRFNYRAKVESLYVDVQVVPQALLPQMIHVLPRLAEVILFTQSDQPPYRELDRTVRWQYSPEILHSFRPSSDQVDPVHAEEKSFYTVLKSWEWSGSLLGGPVTTAKDISLVHQEPSFAHLTKLSFTNFQVPSLYKPRPKPGDEERELELYNEDGAMIDSIAEAISQLKSLSHLVFESSTVMNERLLPLLPKDLVHLGLINCWEVKSEEFASFLHSHGRHLRSLNLSHNQSLDLAFLTTLADACPHLEELYMNLSYFRHHDSLSLVNNDADPLYDQALLPHQIPQWPSSLRVIDFEHIRHWSVETAEMFLQSLIDSAGSLPNLRHVAVKTMLNIPWKARATMRHEWRRKLDKVFLRRFEPPKKHYSLRQTEEEKEEVVEKKTKPKRLSDGPSRRSTRLAAQASDSDSRHSSNSKGLRSLHGRPTYAEPETDENEFESDSEEEQGAEGSPVSSQTENEDERADSKEPLPPKTLVIQGLCTSVSIVFDNQKPTEMQYGMEDFMDEDRAESDDEWDGDQEDDDDPVFVWR